MEEQVVARPAPVDNGPDYVEHDFTYQLADVLNDPGIDDIEEETEQFVASGEVPGWEELLDDPAETLMDDQPHEVDEHLDENLEMIR